MEKLLILPKMLKSRPRMSDVVPNSTSAPSDLAWRVIGLTNLYRLLLPPVLLVLQGLSTPGILAPSQDPRLFQLVCYAYLILGVLLILARRVPRPSLRILALVNASVDTLAISLILYASGGAGSGLGILLVLPVGAMALLGRTKDSFLVPAIATLGLLAQQIAANLAGFAPPTDFTTAGMLGVVLFVIGLSVLPIADRLRESEALVRRQEVDLANLEELSHYIVQHLRESILVVDPSDRIRLINESAAQVLGEAAAVPGALIGEVSPRLLYLLSTWRGNDSVRLSGEAETLVAADGARMIRPHFAPLGDSNPAPALVFLEDIGELAAKVQQTKLAALGRLSASIAHEIRNPIGAMSHAAQLLAESPDLRAEDRRLSEIVQTNSTRVSGIIDNILQLSRREVSRPEALRLGAWTARFREEFCATEQLQGQRLRIDPASDDVEVHIDGSQLHQILWNLCQNAVMHALPHAGGTPIELRYGRLGGMGRPYLQIADRGPGIGIADAERIFEPFFTRAQRGTGLGLFLARELAAANRATLLHEAREGGGSVFRMVFADPHRWNDL